MIERKRKTSRKSALFKKATRMTDNKELLLDDSLNEKPIIEVGKVKLDLCKMSSTRFRFGFYKVFTKIL